MQGVNLIIIKCKIFNKYKYSKFFPADMECESWSVRSDLKPITLKHEALLCDNNCLAPSVTLTTAAISTVMDIALDTYKVEVTSVNESDLDAVSNVQVRFASCISISFSGPSQGFKNMTLFQLRLIKSKYQISNPIAMT